MDKPKAIASHPDKQKVRDWLERQRDAGRSKTTDQIKQELGWFMIKQNQTMKERR